MSDTIIFDPANQLLTISGERAQLSPKAFSVLEYLHDHKQKLVTKDDLLSAVWPKVFVTDAVLKVAVGELRKVLNDHPKQPTFIETVHRRGYRFIGDLTLPGDEPAISKPLPPTKTQTPSKAALFGRDSAIQQIDQCWDETLSGQKKILFINGDAGLGKTALISHWLNEQMASPSDSILASVSCFNQHDSSEPYLPILNALSYLLKNPQHTATVKTLLRQYAPSWLLQMPSLLEENELEALKQELFGVTKQRMLREFVDFIEAVAQSTAILLCIEDLHWSDTASLDLIMALAQRQSLDRFMLLGSFRTSELRQEGGALSHVYSQLKLHQLCQTLDLSALSEDEISSCIEQRLPKTLRGEAYIELFSRYTEGNPLMLTAAIEHINQTLKTISTASDAESNTPKLDLQTVEEGISGGLKQLLSLKIANLNKDDRQLLQAASVSSTKFATESVAAVLQKDVLDIEEACEDQLLHEQWIVPEGSENWPDGSISESYRFWHQLYRQYFYDTLSAARRRHYHLGFANRLLSGFQGKLTDLAPQLAYHFEAAGDLPQAIEFRGLATQQAAQRFAYAEAIQHITKVIELSESQEDPTTHLDARKKYCSFLLASGKLPETIAAYKVLIEASQKAESTQCEIDATLGLADALFWVDRQACLDTAEQAVSLSSSSNDKNLIIHTNGKRVHYRSVIEGYQDVYATDYEAAYQLAQSLDDTALQCVHYPRHLYFYIIRSKYRKASELAEKASQTALSIGDAASYLSCEFFHAWALFYEGRWGGMLTVMDDSLALAQKNGHIPWVLHFQLQKAWLLLHVFDYEGAREICLPIFQQASLGPANSLYFFSQIILMRLEKQAPEQSTEYDYVSEVLDRLKEQPLAIDWVLRFPLQQALAEHYLKYERWPEAKSAALQLHSLASSSGEQTYLVMAEYFLSQVAVAEQQSKQHQKHLKEASKWLAEAELPVIAWRVETLQDNPQAAKSAINKLMDNMKSAPELLKHFKNAEQIQAILRK